MTITGLPFDSPNTDAQSGKRNQSRRRSCPLARRKSRIRGARQALLLHRAGVVRFLAYLNHANMGNYEKRSRNFQNGETPTPDIISTRREGRHKYGFGLNFEQEITPRDWHFRTPGLERRPERIVRLHRSRSHLRTRRVLERRSLETPQRPRGPRLRRQRNRQSHQKYLALGGLGFLLGDGNLNYGPRKLSRAFYTAHVWRGIFRSFDVQHINNPGYNQDRGPVVAPGLRLHVDF